MISIWVHIKIRLSLDVKIYVWNDHYIAIPDEIYYDNPAYMYNKSTNNDQIIDLFTD